MINLFISLFAFLMCGQDNPIVKLASDIHKKYNSNKDYVVIIDYSKPITSERLYVVDVKNQKVIIKSTVSHARNSGDQIPTDFSNEINSKKSSLGLYKTGITYYGKYGYSLKLVGLELKNSNAEKRSIIFHSNKLMKTNWSWGCFATPENTNTKIINKIKNGCLVYVFK